MEQISLPENSAVPLRREPLLVQKQKKLNIDLQKQILEMTQRVKQAKLRNSDQCYKNGRLDYEVKFLIFQRAELKDLEKRLESSPNTPRVMTVDLEYQINQYKFSKKVYNTNLYKFIKT